MRPLPLILGMSVSLAAHAQAPVMKPGDLILLHGFWMGELMYIDYTTGAETHIPANLELTPITPGRWIIGFGYTKEPQANNKDTLVLSDDGRVLDGHAVLEVTQYASDSIRIVLETEGEDDQRPATLRKTWTIGSQNCTLRKDVRLHPEKEGVPTYWFLRHEYRLRR